MNRNNIEKICPICNNKFISKIYNEKYCTRNCYRLRNLEAIRVKENKNKIEKICEVCNNNFTSTTKWQLTCSKECFNERRKLKDRLNAKHNNELRKISDGKRRDELNKQQREYYKTHREIWKISSRNYHQNNREKVREMDRKYFRRKYDTDPEYRLRHILRARFIVAIKNGYKYSSVSTLTGCSMQQLKYHLEQQFQPGMSWDNQGVLGWHIDHIIPITAFDMTDIKEQKKCFHYSNLQPLWYADNIRKSNNLIEVTV